MSNKYYISHILFSYMLLLAIYEISKYNTYFVITNYESINHTNNFIFLLIIVALYTLILINSNAIYSFMHSLLSHSSLSFQFFHFSSYSKGFLLPSSFLHSLHLSLPPSSDIKIFRIGSGGTKGGEGIKIHMKGEESESKLNNKNKNKNKNKEIGLGK
jgi:hypothetical protein